MNDEKIQKLASQIYYALIAWGNSDLSLHDLSIIELTITEYFYALGTYEDESEDEE